MDGQMTQEQIQMMTIQQQIINLEAELSSNTSEIGDYRIIKTYEARLNNEKDPYDTDDLLTKRQKVRDQINELQAKLDKLQNTNSTN